MQDSPSGAPPEPLDHVDRALIETLQINPRASWTAVGSVLRIDPVTAARRWQRLEQEGLAWVSVYPVVDQQMTCALVDIGTKPADRRSVARAIADDPHVYTLERTTGSPGLRAIVVAASLEELTERSLDRMEGIPGVRLVEAHLVTHMYSEGARWRMRELTAAQVAEVHETVPRPPTGVGLPEETVDTALLAALVRNGRATGTELADVLGTTPPTARRRLERAVAGGRIIFRCDVAQSFTEWPVCTTFRAAVRPERLRATAQTLTSLPEIRMCLAVTGRYNLAFSVWLKGLDDAHRLESLLGERLPDLEIGERTVVLRPYKSGGRAVDRSGRAVGAGNLVPAGPFPSAGGH
ncbi:Lrp/AsnC family transcriptional regulator [Yinghuangia aomiensis]|uniref:Lrp/AsnC family transcriptional regulator n=1 Tax=Yinghuangia aomiensis TaxID=676205 RepID=A0ABP9I569_9ACTN